MRRRDIVAGVGSLGVLGGAGYLLRNGPPRFEDDNGDDDDAPSDEPIEIETIDAQGSEEGSMVVPSADATVLMFFVTGCGNCQAQTPRFADAHAQFQDDRADDVRFLAVTYQSQEQLPPDDLREWWHTHDGDGHVGYNGSGLSREYGAAGYPITIVIDADGDERWRETGAVDSSTIAAEVEAVLEEAAEDESSDDEPGDEASDGGSDDADEEPSEDDASTENETDDE
jgi:thiol-disulfide isomerase/thioredoxin